jgi:hypothetical protein
MNFMGLKAQITKDSTGAVPDEWVMPSFFMDNTFTGSKSFKPSYLAKVSGAFDPDECLEAFAKQYPGIPRQMLEDMLAATTLKLTSNKAAAFKEGALVRPVVTTGSASLVSSDTGEILVLWENLDPGNYL